VRAVRPHAALLGLCLGDGDPAMNFFQESTWSQERALQPEAATYYREVLATHANRPETGACAVCQLPNCPDWRDAYDRLAVAGEPIAPFWGSKRGD